MAVNPERLECLSIIVCDEVYRDEATKKLVIVGTFNAVHAMRMPYRHPKMHVLISVTNGVGEYQVRLAVEHGDSGTAIAEVTGPMKFENPLHIADINVALRDLEFSVPGKYWVTLQVDGEIIRQRPFDVIIHQQPPKMEGLE